MKPLLFALAALAFATSAFAGDTYTNHAGHHVRRPVHASHRPAGATAQCRDGIYSFSENHRGTYSHPGGVAVLL